MANKHLVHMHSNVVNTYYQLNDIPEESVLVINQEKYDTLEDGDKNAYEPTVTEGEYTLKTNIGNDVFLALSETYKSYYYVTSSEVKLPTADQIEFGEIAVNYASGRETMSVKNASNEIVTFSSDKQIGEAVEQIVNDVENELNGNISRVEGKADWANDQIDKTTMRVYRDGGYNIDQCLYYGYWFGCTTGRPGNTNARGETYSVEVENAFTGERELPSILNKAQSDGGWDGGFGYYTAGGVKFVERYYGNYPYENEEICSQSTFGIPNGLYTIKIHISASSTQERDSYMAEPILDKQAFLIKINGSTPDWNFVDGSIENDYAEKRFAFDELSKVRVIQTTIMVTNNNIDVRLYSGVNGTANWFTFYVDEISNNGINYVDREVANYFIIKQTASSSVDATKVYQRLIFTTDRGVYEQPTTVYGTWKKLDDEVASITKYLVANLSDTVLTLPQLVEDAYLPGTYNVMFGDEQENWKKVLEQIHSKVWSGNKENLFVLNIDNAGVLHYVTTSNYVLDSSTGGVLYFEFDGKKFEINFSGMGQDLDWIVSDIVLQKIVDDDTRAVSSDAVYEALKDIGDLITVDSEVTEGSDNPVSGDGVYKFVVANEEVVSHALNDLNTRLLETKTEVEGKQDVLTIGDGLDLTDNILSIPNNAITTAKIEDDGVTTAKILDGAVTTDKLGSSSVTTAKILDGAVTTDKLGSSSVTTAKILDGAVTTDKLGSSSVTTAKIEDGAVLGAKIADSAIVKSKIKDNAVDSNKIDYKSIAKPKTVYDTDNAHVFLDKNATELENNSETASIYGNIFAGLGENQNAYISSSEKVYKIIEYVTEYDALHNGTNMANAPRFYVFGVDSNGNRVNLSAISKTTGQGFDVKGFSQDTGGQYFLPTYYLMGNNSSGDDYLSGKIDFTVPIDILHWNEDYVSFEYVIVSGQSAISRYNYQMSAYFDNTPLYIVPDNETIVLDGNVMSVADESIVEGKLSQSVQNKLNASYTGEDGVTISGSIVSLEDGGVTTDKLASNAVTTAKIVDGAVTTDKLASNAITTAKIVDEAVTANKLGNNAVTTDKIEDESVVSAKIDYETLSEQKISPNAEVFLDKNSTVLENSSATANTYGAVFAGVGEDQHAYITSSEKLYKIIEYTNTYDALHNGTNGPNAPRFYLFGVDSNGNRVNLSAISKTTGHGFDVEGFSQDTDGTNFLPTYYLMGNNGSGNDYLSGKIDFTEALERLHWNDNYVSFEYIIVSGQSAIPRWEYKMQYRDIYSPLYIVPDNETIVLDGNVMSVADGGVTTDKLGSHAVTTEKIVDGAVTTAKIEDESITPIKLSGLARDYFDLLYQMFPFVTLSTKEDVTQTSYSALPQALRTAIYGWCQENGRQAPSSNSFVYHFSSSDVFADSLQFANIKYTTDGSTWNSFRTPQDFGILYPLFIANTDTNQIMDIINHDSLAQYKKENMFDDDTYCANAKSLGYYLILPYEINSSQILDYQFYLTAKGIKKRINL